MLRSERAVRFSLLLLVAAGCGYEDELEVEYSHLSSCAGATLEFEILSAQLPPGASTEVFPYLEAFPELYVDATYLDGTWVDSNGNGLYEPGEETRQNLTSPSARTVSRSRPAVFGSTGSEWIAFPDLEAMEGSRYAAARHGFEFELLDVNLGDSETLDTTFAQLSCEDDIVGLVGSAGGTLERTTVTLDRESMVTIRLSVHGEDY